MFKWLTLKFDEWICVTSGCVLINYYEGGDKKQLEVSAGETCFVAKNEMFQPQFPIVPTTYNPVCLPAFDRKGAFEKKEILSLMCS